MNRLAKNRFSLAVTFAIAALTIALAAAKPAAANDLFLTSGSYDATDATYSNIYAGEDSSGHFSNNGVPYVATLNVKSGANLATAFGYNTSTMNISGGSVYQTLCGNSSTMSITGGNVHYASGYNSSTMNITGGSVLEAFGYNSNTMNISGGAMIRSAFGSDNSTTNISGGSVSNAIGSEVSTFNISGGSLLYAKCSICSTFNISGGTLPNGLELYESTSTANFIGAGLSYVYNGYNNRNPTEHYFDAFTISGTFAGASQSYQVYLYNPDDASGTANSTPRQFVFYGQSVTAVPEAGTLALASIGFAVVGIGFVRRKRN